MGKLAYYKDRFSLPSMRHVLRAPGGCSEVMLHQGEEGVSFGLLKKLFCNFHLCSFAVPVASFCSGLVVK